MLKTIEQSLSRIAQSAERLASIAATPGLSAEETAALIDLNAHLQSISASLLSQLSVSDSEALKLILQLENNATTKISMIKI
ncbi:hypothetical protein P5704_027010 (plasmid) [Pseudomonas sp. FeN3W]|nr:hypothetical protein P5704_027010 [Pseudomonas sp. FeN3W]